MPQMGTTDLDPTGLQEGMVQHYTACPTCKAPWRHRAPATVCQPTTCMPTWSKLCRNAGACLGSKTRRAEQISSLQQKCLPQPSPLSPGQLPVHRMPRPTPTPQPSTPALAHPRHSALHHLYGPQVRAWMVDGAGPWSPILAHSHSTPIGSSQTSYLITMQQMQLRSHTSSAPPAPHCTHCGLPSPHPCSHWPALGRQTPAHGLRLHQRMRQSCVLLKAARHRQGQVAASPSTSPGQPGVICWLAEGPAPEHLWLAIVRPHPAVTSSLGTGWGGEGGTPKREPPEGGGPQGPGGGCGAATAGCPVAVWLLHCPLHPPTLPPTHPPLPGGLGEGGVAHCNPLLCSSALHCQSPSPCCHPCSTPTLIPAPHGHQVPLPPEAPQQPWGTHAMPVVWGHRPQKGVHHREGSNGFSPEGMAFSNGPAGCIGHHPLHPA